MTNVEFTSDVVRSATFREKLKGYNPEDVHAFMERSAAAIDQLTARLADASARALKAEAALASNSEADESVRRTLVLAQRTAEMAVREANDEAATIRGEARREADQLLSEARLGAERLEAEAGERAARLTSGAEQARAEADTHASAVTAQADAHATSVTAEAEAHAATITAEAEARVTQLDEMVAAEAATRRSEALAAVDRETAGARADIEESLAELGRQRDQLWADLEVLTAYLSAERARVLDALHGAVDRFGETLEPAPLPDVERPQPVASPAEAAPPQPAGIGGERSADDAQSGGAGDEAPEPPDLYGWARGPVEWRPEPEHHEEEEAPAAATAPEAQDHPDPWATPEGGDGHDPWATPRSAAGEAPDGWASPEPAPSAGDDPWAPAERGGSDGHEPWAPAERGDGHDPWATPSPAPSAGDDPWATPPADGDRHDPWATAEPGNGNGHDAWATPEPAPSAGDNPWAASAPAGPAWAPTADDPTEWEQAATTDPGWGVQAHDAASADVDRPWSPAAAPEPGTRWGQPVEPTSQGGWAGGDSPEEPAWEWPGRSTVTPDVGPAATWFAPEAGAAHEQPAAWAPQPWDRTTAAPNPADPWRQEDQGWSGRPTTWSGWAEDAAGSPPPSDPWAGSDQPQGGWGHPVPQEPRPEAAEDEHPSRLLFTLSDEARQAAATPTDPEPAPKPKKNLLGRLKG
jgi:DivIVA domain-containing protein